MSSPSRSAFTLLELIVVISVMTILAAIAAPRVLGILGSTAITVQGDEISNAFVVAQQAAISENRPVDLRLLRYQDSSSTTSAGADLVRAFLLVSTDQETGLLEPLQPPLLLPAPVVVAEGAGFSTLADSSNVGIGVGDSTQDSPGLFSGAETYRYTFVRFHPDGSAGLPAKAGSDTWHLTLIDETTAGDPPANFYTIMLDPFTGRVTRFRP